MTTPAVEKPAEDLAPGDIIMFLSTPHLIAEIEPYTHEAFPEAFGIARAADGWGYPLSHGSYVLVAAR